MDGESLDIKQARLQKLKELFPEFFVESQLDWEKLKAAFGDDINFVNERYVLNWAGKSDAFRVLQQPTTATLKPIPEESVNFDKSENLFIEGENLEVLKILQKAYYGKVKCIIIDPPYNTGSDSFIYPDRFSEKKEDYLKRIGDKDEEGFLMKEGLFRKNSKDSGHYHSNWLSMMYPRLFLAKNLLRDDGVIFVHIDDNEVHNLRMVMNEIFGEENFVGELVWKCRAGGGSDSKFFAKDHEYALVFAKNTDVLDRLFIDFTEEEKEKFNLEDERGKYFLKTLERPEQLGPRPNLQYPITAPDGSVIERKTSNKKYTWVVKEEKFKELLNEKRIEFKDYKGRWMVYRKLYLQEIDSEDIRKKKPRTIIENIALTREGGSDIQEIFGMREVFSFPKPSSLTKHLLSIFSDEEYYVLDFFAGSGTTAQAVLELNKEDGGNRKFILVQLPEQCDENSEAFKAGYKTIADIGKERIRRVIKKIEKEKAEKPDLFAEGKLDLGFKVFKLAPSNFKIWRGSEIENEEILEKQLTDFTSPSRPGAEKQNMLYELMLKAGFDLTGKLQHVIASNTKPSRKSKKIDKGSINPHIDSIGYYSINNNELIIALDAINEKLVEQIIASKPQKVITLDNLFTGNDQLKTNTVLQMRDAGVDFKTI